MPNNNEGLLVDPLHLALTRPAMVLGVTYTAFILNAICVMQVFIVTRNLLYLLIFVPIHLIFFGISQTDARAFDLFALWCQTKGNAMLFGTWRFWRASTYSPQSLTIGKRYKNHLALCLCLALAGAGGCGPQGPTAIKQRGLKPVNDPRYYATDQTAPPLITPAPAVRELPLAPASSASAPSVPPPEVPAPPVQEDNGSGPKVKKAGTAAQIAKRNKVAVTDFCRWNGVRPDAHLPVGYQVHLQAPPAQPHKPAPALAAYTPAPAEHAPAPEPATPPTAPAAYVEPTPPTMIYKITPGSLKLQMSAWAAQAGYQFAWKASNDYEMEAAADFSNDLEASAAALFTGLQRAGVPLRSIVHDHPPNKVLVIMEK